MQAFSYSDGKFGSVSTNAEAVAKVKELFSRQLLRAQDESPNPNEGIPGDADAKHAFWMLLDIQTQRKVFIEQCRSTAFWPRIRSLVGSPPFSFLLPKDDALLNPHGICSNRVHMAPKEQAAILSSHEIGRGHYKDEHGRVYSVIASDAARNDLLPFRSVVAGAKIVFDMKLPAQTNATRSEIRKRGNSSAKKTIVFPAQNEIILMELHPDLRNGTSAPVNVRVLGRQQRSATSPVVRLFCVTESTQCNSSMSVVS